MEFNFPLFSTRKTLFQKNYLTKNSKIWSIKLLKVTDIANSWA